MNPKIIFAMLFLACTFSVDKVNSQTCDFDVKRDLAYKPTGTNYEQERCKFDFDESRAQSSDL